MDNFLLSETEKENIGKYKYTVEDNSITTILFGKYWTQMETYFPDWIAPNVISISGLLIIIYVWNLCKNFYDSNPLFVGLFTIFGIITYVNFDSVDGIHARKTKNSSPLGELIDHGCDSFVTIFLVLIGCQILKITNLMAIWYIVGTCVLMFQYSHLQALTNSALKFDKYSGPFEIVGYYCILLLLQLFGIPYIDKIGILLTSIAPTTFFMAIVANILYVNLKIRPKDRYTTMGCSIVYGIFIIKAYFLTEHNVTETQILSEYISLALLTIDLIISKMAKKSISHFVVLLILMSQIDSIITTISIIAIISQYIKEISNYLDIPIFTTNINVYCNGVFDLCHIGHKKMFENAKSFGNKLIVGIHSDDTVKSYKRNPIMTHDERCNVVKYCKHVNIIVPNADLYITDEFIDNNNIHIVVCSDEYYDNPNDVYYIIPRKRGILRRLKYSNEISTSDLIKRIANSK